MSVKQKLVDFLRQREGPWYGVFLDGKLRVVTRKRVYLQPGRAKTELISQSLYSTTNRDITKDWRQDIRDRKELIKNTVQELIDEGRLEIREL